MSVNNLQVKDPLKDIYLKSTWQLNKFPFSGFKCVHVSIRFRSVNSTVFG